jgi:hypothetical protein
MCEVKLLREELSSGVAREKRRADGCGVGSEFRRDNFRRFKTAQGKRVA